MAMGFAMNRRAERLMTPTGRSLLQVGGKGSTKPSGSLPRAFCLRPLTRILPRHGAGLVMTPFNESQTRTLLVGCLDIHRRMAEMEAMLVQSLKPSPFGQYINDLS